MSSIGRVGVTACRANRLPYNNSVTAGVGEEQHEKYINTPSPHRVKCLTGIGGNGVPTHVSISSSIRYSPGYIKIATGASSMQYNNYNLPTIVRPYVGRTILYSFVTGHLWESSINAWFVEIFIFLLTCRVYVCINWTYVRLVACSQ